MHEPQIRRMEATPRKLVQWDIGDISLSGLGSPFVDGSMDSMVSTSSLEYINAQLVAHGFAPSPGLSLDGISNKDCERVVKCLLGMLSQRVEDMSRTEDLTTKLRMLTYDHERLLTMHRNTTEKAANAEREMNVHKSRLATTTRTLQSTENAHKQTVAELQRTRTLLQGVRSAHQTELKKKEKEVERIVEKWAKISDAQTKLLAAPSGIRCANVAVVEGSEILGKGQGFLEIALDEAEKARSQLGEENMNLRRLVLKAVNDIQSVLYQARSLLSDSESEPAPFTLTTLFPLAPLNNASDKLIAVLTGLRDCLSSLSQPNTNPISSTSKTSPVSNDELERLEGVIAALKEELELSQKQSVERAADTQAMFDKFAQDHRRTADDIAEMSMELMSVPLRDEEKERLDKIKKDLELERQKFTDATIKFGKEKAALEAERVKLIEEKRSWQVEMMLADLPPTPIPGSPARTANAIKPSPRKSPRKSLRKSPSKSPAKPISIGKTSGRRAKRVSRRSFASPSKVIPSYETEVLPPIPAPTFSSFKPLPFVTSILPDTFVLPPPSPHASLPTQPALPPPVSPPEIPDLRVQPPAPESTSSSSATLPESNTTVPSTPLRHPFPVAKPFAQRMIHAYSPAKPSPLSRILMLADSPSSPPPTDLYYSPSSGGLQVVAEEEDDGGGLGCGSVPLFSSQPPPAEQQPQMSLAAELGVESPPDTPLQEKKVAPNAASRPIAGAAAVGRRRVFYPDPSKKPLSAKDKGKGRAEPVVNITRPRTAAVGEKENGISKKMGKVSPVLGGTFSKTSPTGTTDARKPLRPEVKSTMVSTSRGKVASKLPPPAKGGPRRVLVDSADAPPIKRRS